MDILKALRKKRIKNNNIIKDMQEFKITKLSKIIQSAMILVDYDGLQNEPLVNSFATPQKDYHVVAASNLN